MMRWRLLLERARRQDGFTVIEVLMAVTVFAVAMMVMTAMIAGGLKGVLQSKQRTSATGNANQVLEQARNLAYEDVGLVAGDPTLTTAADPALIQQGGSLFYQTGGTCNGGLEPLSYATNTATHPYNPHKQTNVQVGSTRLTRFVYVTGVDQDCNGTVDLKRVTVRTLFANPAYAAGAIKNEVIEQTLISPRSPGAPGAPPVGGDAPALSGIGSSKAPSITMLVDKGKGACLPGASYPSCARTPQQLDVGLTSSQSQTKVISTPYVDCLSTSPSASAGSGDAVVSRSESRSADGDPTTGSPSEGPNTGTKSYAEPAKPPNGVTDSYLVEPDVRSTLACSATAPSPVNGPASSGSAKLDSTMTMSADVTNLGLGTGAVMLMQAAGARSDSTVTHSGSTQTDRQVNLGATSTLTSLSVLPVTVLGLAATSGFVNVQPFALMAGASANATTPSMPPTLSTGTGLSVSVFDPAFALGTSSTPGSPCQGRLAADPYCRIVISPTFKTPSGSDFTGLTIDTSQNMCPDLGTCAYSYSFSTHIEFQTRKIVNGAPTPDGNLYEASYAPMTASTRLILRLLDVSDPLKPTYVPYFDAQVQIDLGSITARACYGLASGASGCL